MWFTFAVGQADLDLALDDDHEGVDGLVLADDLLAGDVLLDAHVLAQVVLEGAAEVVGEQLRLLDRLLEHLLLHLVLQVVRQLLDVVGALFLLALATYDTPLPTFWLWK